MQAISKEGIGVRRYGLLYLWLAAFSAGCASCSGNARNIASAATESPVQVEVTTVKSKKLNTTERLPAELVPYESVDIYAKETGFVKTIKVDRGSRVRQGQLLAEIEAPELVAQRAQANAAYQSSVSQLAAGEAKLASDQATYEHMSSAAKIPGVVAANDLDIAEKTVQSDGANVAALKKTAQAAQENLRAVSELESYLKITAPFDGQVTSRYVHPGTLVGPGSGPGTVTPLVRIETTTRHRLVVPVPENDVSGVPEGTVVSFTVPSFPGRTFHAPIARISHEVDVKTRTMPVELDVRDPRAELVPGSFSEVEWPIRRTYPTLVVPISAVASDLQRSFVIRVNQNRAEWVDVTSGAKVGNMIEVFGNLHEGDKVAVRGTDQVRSGTQVSPHPGTAK
jgi:membrane fusion protein, multidrug efflux system